MAIKIAFFDIDWTLYDHAAKQWVDSGLEAIKELSRRGVKIIICSARPYHSQKHFGCFDLGIPWDGYICSCGAYAEVEGQVVIKELMDEKKIKRLCNSAKKRNLCMEFITLKGRFLYGEPNEYMDAYHAVYNDVVPEQKDYVGEESTGCLLFCPKEMDEAIQAENPDIVYFRFHETGVDVMEKPRTKGEAMAKVMAFYGFKKEEAIGFGDDFQDMSMADCCGEFVCVGNGREEVKAVATYVTDPIAEDGIANALRHFQLI